MELPARLDLVAQTMSPTTWFLCPALHCVGIIPGPPLELPQSPGFPLPHKWLHRCLTSHPYPPLSKPSGSLSSSGRVSLSQDGLPPSHPGLLASNPNHTQPQERQRRKDGVPKKSALRKWVWTRGHHGITFSVCPPHLLWPLLLDTGAPLLVTSFDRVLAVLPWGFSLLSCLTPFCLP